MYCLIETLRYNPTLMSHSHLSMTTHAKSKRTMIPVVDSLFFVHRSSFVVSSIVFQVKFLWLINLSLYSLLSAPFIFNQPLRAMNYFRLHSTIDMSSLLKFGRAMLQGIVAALDGGFYNSFTFSCPRRLFSGGNEWRQRRGHGPQQNPKRWQ
jgi:hypothetical protein